MPEPPRQPASGTAKRPASRSRRKTAKPPQRSQRERLVDAMVELSAESGYHAVTVAHLSARAGVSSATFYEQFDRKEECLLAAYSTVAARVFARVQHELDGAERTDVLRRVVGAMLRSVQGDPDAGRVMFIEALAGGPRLREELRLVLAEFERRAEEFLDDPSADGRTLDIPAMALVGAVRSIVARHLRTHSEDLLASLLEDMLTWMESYSIAPGRARWSTGAHARLPPAPAREPSPPGENALMPARLPRGRHGLSASVVARSQRTRIIQGIAEVMLSKGYADATVTDIVTAAGVARDAFYQHFTDKQHAFLEAQQYPTQYILDSGAASYFAEDEWPARVWSGLKTLLALIAENPAQSHLRLVECYAAGPATARRAEEITRSFTIFLEEGYRFRPQAHELPRLCSQLIAGALFEVIQRAVARGDSAELPRHLPQIAYIAIAPFTGPEQAIRMLEQMRARPDPADGAQR